MQSSAERVDTWKPRTVTVTLPSPYGQAYGPMKVEDVGGYAEYGSICYLGCFAFVWVGNEDFPEWGEEAKLWPAARAELENRLELEQRRIAIFCSYQTYKRMQPFARWWQEPDYLTRALHRFPVYAVVATVIFVVAIALRDLF